MSTIAPVVSALSTSLVAVPALSRVDPAITSAPTAGRNRQVHERLQLGAGSQVTKMIRDPALRARVSAPRTNCVMPLGRHADHDVGLGRVEARHRPRAFFVVVLDAFLGAEDRVAAAGHHRLDEQRDRC
jgi:hypothetical protein